MAVTKPMLESISQQVDSYFDENSDVRLYLEFSGKNLLSVEDLLEEPLTDFDPQIVRNRQKVGIEDILEECGLTRSSQDWGKYYQFTRNYVWLDQSYLMDARKLESQQTVQPPDWGRVGKNFMWGCLLGGASGHFAGMYPWLHSIAGGLLGAGLTAYDEIKQTGLNLRRVFLGFAVGIGLGSLVNQGTGQHPWFAPEILLPGAYGLFDAVKKRTKKFSQETLSQGKEELQKEYGILKERLIDHALYLQ